MTPPDHCPTCLHLYGIRGECLCTHPPAPPQATQTPDSIEPHPAQPPADGFAVAISLPPASPLPPSPTGEYWGLYDGPPDVPAPQRLNPRTCGTEPVKAQARAFTRCSRKTPNVTVTCNGTPKAHYQWDATNGYAVVRWRAPRAKTSVDTTPEIPPTSPAGKPQDEPTP